MTLNRLGGPTFSPNKLSHLQDQVDGLVGRFVEEAANPITLTTLTGASLSYRLARWASAGRMWSVPFAFSAEVGVFEMGNRTLGSLPLRAGLKPAPTMTLWSWTGSSGIFQGLLKSGITLGMLKGGGFLVRDQNLILQHLFQGAAMVLGHQSAGILGLTPKPQGSLSEQFLQAEAMILQLSVGMGLAHHLAPGLVGWEKNLATKDTISKGKFFPFSLNEGARPLPAFASAGPSLSPARVPPVDLKLQNSFATARGLPSPEGAKRLKRRFESEFPAEGPETYTSQILEKALQTPCDLPHFHERLLEGLSQSPEKGTYSQALTVEAIRLIFSRNALGSSTGSFDNALLQLLIRSVSADSSPSHRTHAFASLFEAMKEGVSRGRIFQFFLHQGYGRDLHLSQRDLDRNPWVQFQIDEAYENGRYDPREIDPVLDQARGHPFGKLIVRRMLQVFATEDIPAKLRELRSEESSATLDRVLTLLHKGLPPEVVAEEINGTFHTAFIEDMRLARKVVSIYHDLFETQMYPDLQEHRRRFEKTLLEFLFSQDRLTPQGLMDLIRTHREERVEFLYEAWRQNRFKIEILPDRAYDGLLEGWGKSASPYSLFDQRGNRILIREMPLIDLTSGGGQVIAFQKVLGRLKGVVHEGEHWRHTSGSFQGWERFSTPIDLGGIGRQDRLVSETMAYLEENLWSFRNFDDDFGGVASRLGENLPLFFRNLADEAYFRKANEGALRDWWRELPKGF